MTTLVPASVTFGSTTDLTPLWILVAIMVGMSLLCLLEGPRK